MPAGNPAAADGLPKRSKLMATCHGLASRSIKSLELTAFRKHHEPDPLSQVSSFQLQNDTCCANQAPNQTDLHRHKWISPFSNACPDQAVLC